jgi:hypothetical protein
MGEFSGFPVTSSSDLNRHDLLIQPWRAIRRRAEASQAYANNEWPRESNRWEQGVITNANGYGTHVTIADADADWTQSENCTGTRWVNHQCVDVFGDPIGGIPTHYDLVIHSCDERQVIQVPIVANTANTLDVGPAIYDYIAAGDLASIGDLIGRTYYIIKQGGQQWAGRFPPYPNDREKWIGSSSIGTTSTLQSEGKSWTVDEFSASFCDLVTWGDDGRLHRVQITSNTADTIHFATQTWTPSGPWAVTFSGGRSWPGRDPWSCFQWYDGAKQPYWTIHPNDELDTIDQAAQNVSWAVKDHGTGACEMTSFPAMDADLWSAYDEECSPGEFNYSPHLKRTLRALQWELLGLCPYFVRVAPHQMYTPATFLYDLGHGATGTLGTYDSVLGMPVGITPPSDHPTGACYWTTIAADGTVQETGTGTVAGGHLLGTGLDETDEGLTVFVGWGFRRHWMREARWPYPVTVWIADVDTGEEGRGVIDPPDPDGTCFGAGRWVTLPASTTYREHSDIGLTGDTAEPFVTGDLVRITGTNASDPYAGLVEAYAPPDPGMSPDLPYWSHLKVGKHDPINERVIKAQMRGTCTGGGTFWIEDTEKNWFDEVWYDTEGAGGLLRTRTGTAGSGSTTTTLVDFDAYTSPEACYWYDGYRGQEAQWYVGLTVEFTGGANVGQRRVITAQDQNTATLTLWPALPSAPAEGDGFSIKAGYAKNRWAGRPLTVVSAADKSVHEFVISYSDHNRLYFTPGSYTPVAGDTFAVGGWEVGSVLKWNGTGWEKPTGADAVRLGVETPNDFRSDPKANHETVKSGYGHYRKHDVVTPRLINDIYNGILLLAETRIEPTWTADVDGDGIGAKNALNYSLTSSGLATWSLTQNKVATDWNPGTNATSVNGMPPGASRWGRQYGTQSEPTSVASGGAGRVYAWACGSVPQPLCEIENVIKWWNYAQLPPSEDSFQAIFPEGFSGCYDPPDDGYDRVYSLDIQFDALGDPVAQNAWTQWATTGPSTDEGRCSPVLGNTSLTLPPDPGDPGDCSGETYGRHAIHGYVVTQVYGVVAWDFDGAADAGH